MRLSLKLSYWVVSSPPLVLLLNLQPPVAVMPGNSAADPRHYAVWYLRVPGPRGSRV